MPDTEDVYYHVTTTEKWQAIVKTGCFAAGSYFAVAEIADYYEETILDDGEVPVRVAIPACFFVKESMGLDRPGLSEPVCFTAFGKRDVDVYAEWAASDQTVDDCLAIIGSFQYACDLPINPGMWVAGE